MSMPAPTSPDPYRHAALVLHALAPVDREWMLARLPAAQSASLRGLLVELAEFGWPCDATLVDEALAHPAASGQTPVACALEMADAITVHELLAPEPDRVIQAVLYERAWPWRDAVLQRMGPARVQRLLGLQQQRPVPPDLGRACAIELERRLQRERQASLAPAAPAHPTAPAWRRWFARRGRT